MPEAMLADIRHALADIAQSIMRLPESRPSSLPPVVREALGDLINACDLLIAALAGPDVGDPEAGALLTIARAHRRLLYLALAEAAPDRAAFWTEEYREQERATNIKIAAGLIPRFSNDDTFESTLRARWLGEAGA
jgi:hypothetical protein